MRDLLGFILFIIAMWAFVAGVTCNGRHYALRFSDDRGVELVNESVP